MSQTVPLIRWFMPIDRIYEDHGESLEDLWPAIGRRGRTDWQNLRDEHRTVILADAGAGKTFEMKAEAERLAAKHRAALFIRIEDIHSDFGEAFEVGTRDAFEEWLTGTNEAWFFLDSVDEVRLEEPRAFENAIRTFAARIHGASQRAHIYISSRPYAWRSKTDRALVEALLPYETPKRETKGDGEEDLAAPAVKPPSAEDATGSALRLFRLEPLDADDIRIFAGHRGIDDVDALMADLERAALFELARLPFDLEDILATWNEERSLESRLDVLQRGIRRRLAPPKATFGMTLSVDRAIEGARQIALAATLSGESNIRLPGKAAEAGIDAAALLEGWTLDEVTKLLSCGIFSDAIYNMVRFRHREVRELLTAQWFAGKLATASARPKLEGLIFRDVYGEAIVVPRLRPILPWLILFDEQIRTRTLAIQPAIATEGGDAARLPLLDRQKILGEIVTRIVEHEERGGDNSAIARIAHPDLDEDALSLIDRHYWHDDAIFFLGRLAWQGKMKAAAHRLGPVARDPDRNIYSRLVATRAVAAVCGEAARRDLWRDLLGLTGRLPRHLLAELIDDALPDDETVRLLLGSLEAVEPHERFEVTGLGDALHRLIERLPVNGELAPTQPLARLVEGLVSYLTREPHIERRECKVSEEYRWLMAPAMHAVERLITGRAVESFGEAAMTVLTLLPAFRMWDDNEDRDRASALATLVPRWTELNDALFWRTVEERRAILETRGE